VVFSKPPLELALDTPLGPMRMIGVHVKSKAPHGARNDADAMRLSIANRRKQLAQCIWLRERIEAHLDAGEALIVLGDLNDGPGLDLRGALRPLGGGDRAWAPTPRRNGSCTTPMPPRAAKPDRRQTGHRAVLPVGEERYLSALLDYIMVSPGLRPLARSWRIWHPFDDPECWRDPDLRDALLAASDHFPVTLDMAPAA
jgi:endonuclease/exonuclease/phosphatase family metal-dependent hydrolase